MMKKLSMIIICLFLIGAVFSFSAGPVLAKDKPVL